jgi:hypothetical protein
MPYQVSRAGPVILLQSGLQGSDVLANGFAAAGDAALAARPGVRTDVYSPRPRGRDPALGTLGPGSLSRV